MAHADHAHHPDPAAPAAPADPDYPPRRLRADARRNHQQILEAARDLFVERGADAPLEDIARRAGVGIATLYRRFGDRGTLMRAVVLDALVRTREAAERSLDEEGVGLAALVRYMHAVLDLRTSAVIPVLLGETELDGEEIGRAREASARAVEAVIDAAHADGSLPADVTFGDVALMLVRLARPLPGDLPPDLNARLAHRHLDLLVDGLRPRGDGGGPLAGPAMDRADLRKVREGREGRPTRDPAGPP